MLRFRMVERRGEEAEASIHVEGKKKEGGMREPNSWTRTSSTQPVAAIAEQMESDGREQKGSGRQRSLAKPAILLTYLGR